MLRRIFAVFALLAASSVSAQVGESRSGGSSGSSSSTITNGVTATSGCLAGGVLRSISNLVECGAGFTYASGVAGLGTASTTTGILRLLHASHAFFNDIQQSATQAASITYTLPTTDGGASEFLQTNGSGVLTWAAAGGGVTIGDTQVAYATTANTLGGDAGMIYTSGSDLLTLLGGVTVGSTTTAGTATTSTLGTISGASATSNFLNVTGTFPGTLSAATHGVYFDFVPDNDAQTQSGMYVRLSGANAGAASYAARFSNGTSTNNIFCADDNGTCVVTIQDGGQLRLINGAVGAPALSDSAGTTGVYFGGSSAVWFSSGGVNSGIVQSTQSQWRNLLPLSGSVFDLGTPGIRWRALYLDGASTTGGFFLGRTITAAMTTGAQTIDKIAGTVNFAAAATTLVVTNNMVTADSIVMAVRRTNDTTCFLASVEPAAGSFTIRMTAACAAETSVGFVVTN